MIPASLSCNDGLVVASACQECLVKYNITDVDVEIHESLITCSAGPNLKLISPSYSSNPTVDVCEPLTAMLGLPICAQSTPWAEGTGGFFITTGENTASERLLLVTACHVVFMPDQNNHFVHASDSQLHHNVTLFGDTAFNKYLESIQFEIRGKEITAEWMERVVKEIEEKDSSEVKEEALAKLNKAREAVEKLNAFYLYVSTHWAPPESHVLGHVILSPPIDVSSGSNLNSEGYTEDWAVIEIDASKLNKTNFSGNAIDLGTSISVDKFTCMIDPNPQHLHFFKYPHDCHLRLQGTISDEEMCHPPALDKDGELCLMVTKHGTW